MDCTAQPVLLWNANYPYKSASVIIIKGDEAAVVQNSRAKDAFNCSASLCIVSLE
jgi:hypothetical protein